MKQVGREERLLAACLLSAAGDLGKAIVCPGR